MATLFDVMVQTARLLEALHEGRVTGAPAGSEVIDNLLPVYGYTQNNYFNGGTVFMLRAGGADPEGQSAIVTDYDGSSGTLTFANSFSGGAPAVGDIYGVMTARYPRALLVDKINQALRELGDYAEVDISLTTEANKTRYQIPLAAKRDVRAIWLATKTGNIEDYGWVRVFGARVQWEGVGDEGWIIFPYQPAVGYKIKFVYMTPHPLVYVADSPVTDPTADDISEYVEVDWLALAAAANCVRWRLAQPGDNTQQLTAQLNDLLAREERAHRRRRPPTPATAPTVPYTEVS